MEGYLYCLLFGSHSETQMTSQGKNNPRDLIDQTQIRKYEAENEAELDIPVRGTTAPPTEHSTSKAKAAQLNCTTNKKPESLLVLVRRGLNSLMTSNVSQ